MAEPGEDPDAGTAPSSAATPPLVIPPAEPPPGKAPAQRSRRLLIDAIFAFAVLVGVFAVLAVWVHRQVLDTNNWTNTSSQLLADPKIQAAVGSLLVNELFDSVDVAGELKTVMPGNLAGLAAPAAAGLRSLAIRVAPQVLSTAVVQRAWRQANRTAQLELVRILSGGHRTITTNNGVVSLQLHPLLTQLAAQIGLQQQLATVQTQLESSNGTAARGAVQQKLGVKIPPPSGSIVILRSSQLKTAQNIVKAIKGLAFVLPTLALLLFALAVWLAEGRRRVAVRTTGWCLIGIGFIVVIARRVIDDSVVGALVKVPSDKPAAHQAFNIGTTLLYDAAIALITYGLAVVIAAWIAGPTRPAHALRRALAPSLRLHVAYVYAVAGLALLLLVVWGPFPSTRQPIPVIGIAILLALGIRALRKVTEREFPDAQMGDLAQSLRDWLSARRDALLAGVASPRQTAPAGAVGDPRVADLERLADLHERGALTDEEFRAQKASLLRPQP